MPFSDAWAALVKDLSQPEYLHVLLNPLPLYGLAMGILGLIINLVIFKNHQASRITALMLLCISALSVWPVMHYGERGYDRVLSMSNDDGVDWLKAHENRADRVEPFYYALAALAAAAILAPLKYPKSALPFAIATLLLAIGCAAGGAWIGYAGGKVRHSEFRNEPPPVPTE